MRLLRRHGRAWGIQCGDTAVAVELGLRSRREVHDVERTSIGPGIRHLNGRISDHRVVSNQVFPYGSSDVDAIRVAGDEVLFDDVATGRTDQTNAEVVWRVAVSVTVRSVQPDPAVVADYSYAAAGRSRHSGSIPEGGIAFNERAERAGGHEDPRPAVGRDGEPFNASLS